MMDKATAETTTEKPALDDLTGGIIEALRTVYDPEIPVNIFELGLIYKIDVKENSDVEIDMTLTAPACPVAGEMPHWVEKAVSEVDGVGDVKVNLVFDPPWDPSKMSEEAKLELGFI
jgi:FeS assembly SUF system protein